MKKTFKAFLVAAFVVTEFFVIAVPWVTTSAKAEGAIQAITHAGFGGGTDVTTRMMLLRARRVLKQDMQLVNKKVVVEQYLWITWCHFLLMVNTL